MPTQARVVLVVLLVAATAAAAFAASAPATASPVVKKINKVRRAHGLPSLRYSPNLSHSSRRFARHLMRVDRFAHAHRIRAKGRFWRLGEVLGRHRGWRLQGSRIVRGWLRSRHHRSIVLSRRFNRVGAAPARGRLWGRPSTIWVAQFGRAR